MSAGANEELGRILLDAAGELNRQIETVHERQACPKCRAPVGTRCCAMPLGYRPSGARMGRVVHSHAERVRLEVPLR